MAETLNQVSPGQLWATASPDSIRIRVGATESSDAPNVGFVEIRATSYANGAEYESEVEEFALTILGEVQEMYMENVTHTGWPPSDPDEPMNPQKGNHLPAPYAEVIGDQLCWWYGDRERLALTLPPLRLDSG